MYVITGATGNTGKVVAEQLLAQKQAVRVLGRSAERLQGLVAKGAEALVADVTDVDGLTKALTGARAVYAMVPPNMAEPDFRAYQVRVIEALATAIAKSGVRHVVALSSIGADKAEKTGPVAGLYAMERRFGKIAASHVLFLRAGYFMENTLAQVGVIKTMGVAAGPVRADVKLPMIATRDIGAAAADALLKLDFIGKTTRELLGERDLSYDEATHIIGEAIGRPGLTYVEAPDEQLRPVLAQMGMSLDAANQILELARALSSGHVRALEGRSAKNSTPTSFEKFVQEEFVPAYQGKSAAA